MGSQIRVPQAIDMIEKSGILSGQYLDIFKYATTFIDEIEDVSKKLEVQTYSYEFNSGVNKVDNLGLSTRLQADFGVGYTLPLCSVYTNRYNIAFNPKVFMEFASHNYIVFHCGLVSLRFNIDLTAFKFTPFDLQVLVGMESPEFDDHLIDYCYGMQFITETMNVGVTMEVEVKECSFGLFGLMIGDYSDCYWRTYNIEEPLAQVEFLHALDIDSRNYYFPWSCNYNLLDDAGMTIENMG